MTRPTGPALDRLRRDVALQFEERAAHLAIARGLVTPAQLESARTLKGLVASGALTAEQARTLMDALVDTGKDQSLLGHRYLLGPVLGQGGMAVVYAAQDVQLGRPVAIKLIREEFSFQASARERLEREASVLAQVSHPNLVQVLDVGMEPRPYIVMEAVAGSNLQQQIDAREVTPRRAAEIIEKVALAIHEVHRRGIIHRDLKPANILMTERGEPKVADFGIARVLDAASGTTSGAVAGTPHYMAYEQLAGPAGALGPWTDVYALGVVLYVIAAGRTPYAGNNMAQIWDEMSCGLPAPPRSVRPDLSPDLEAIILRAIHRSPRDRYPTAKALADDLRCWIEGRPVSARRAGIAMHLRRWTGRHRTAIAVGGLAVTGSIALAAWGISGWTSAARDREALDRAERARQAREAAEAGERHQIGVRAQADQLLRTAQADLEAATRLLYVRRAAPEAILKRTRDAAQAVEAALALSDQAWGHHLLGRARLLEGRLAEAEQCWRRALELDPALTAARIDLGRTLVAHAFVEVMLQAPSKKEGSQQAELLTEEAARVLARLEGLDRDASLLADAMLAYARGDLAQARTVAAQGAKVMAGREGEEDFHWLIGVSSDPEAGRPDLDRAIEIRPQFPLARFARGVKSHLLGRLDDALADYDAAVLLTPSLYAAWYNRGQLHLTRGDFAAALHDFNEAVRLAPQKPGILFQRGYARERSGDKDGALLDYNEVLALATDHLAARARRGQIRFARGDAPGAEADFTHVIAGDPTSVPAYVNRGNARQVLGDLPGAIKDYTEALRLDPNTVEALINRALTRSAGGDRTGARADLMQAVERTPLEQTERRAKLDRLLRELGQ
jgi:serine/threonine-protein kinase